VEVDLISEKTANHTLLFAASEFGGIAHTGGLGDVVRDLSRELYKKRMNIAVIIPAYSKSTETGILVYSFKTPFGGRLITTEILKLDFNKVPVYQIRNKLFFEEEYGNVYIDSGKSGRGPFEDDAKRFAFFSAAVAESLLTFPPFRKIRLLHCHDWHTGVLLTLLRYDPRFVNTAAGLRIFFTIHNLGYQGVRPFVYGKTADLLSFQSWFPKLYNSGISPRQLSDIKDPVAKTPCFNPIRAGIRLADIVTTVSPTYAHEITLPDNGNNCFIGGSGLEKDLTRLAKQGRLSGILNGIDYNSCDPGKLSPPYEATDKDLISKKTEYKLTFLERLQDRIKNSKNTVTAKSLFKMKNWKNRPLLIFISRAVKQKAGILFKKMPDGVTLLGSILNLDISLIVLASGELNNDFQAALTGDNALYMDTFDRELATALYAAGDILLMPSYFEPCGISQLIAMRYGCLPLVHEIGGLADTVTDETGFSYNGTNLIQQQNNLLSQLRKALAKWHSDKNGWETMMRKAMGGRFTWEEPAKIYRQLYNQL